MEPDVNNEKPKFNWKRLLITVGIVLLTAAIIGGTVWYFMDKQAKEDKTAAEKTTQDLQKQIDDLKKNSEMAKTTQSTTTNTTATVAVDDIKLAKAACLKNAGSAATVREFLYEESNGGYFGKCDVFLNPTGYVSFVKKINSVWTEIYKGQQPPSEATRSQYGIPVDL